MTFMKVGTAFQGMSGGSSTAPAVIPWVLAALGPLAYQPGLSEGDFSSPHGEEVFLRYSHQN